MKINFKQFKEKSFFIPLNAYGQWADYKQYSGQEWRQNIVNVLRIVIAAENPTAPIEQVTHSAEKQIDTFIQTIKANLSPERPCLALAFAPAKCWFVAFVVEAFLPLENASENNLFERKYYAEAEQTVEIVKAKGNPIQFAFDLVKDLES